jgi:hypothetical protein
MLISNLSKLSPDGMLTSLRQLPPDPPARWRGYWSEVVFINRRAARLYARWSRISERIKQ